LIYDSSYQPFNILVRAILGQIPVQVKQTNHFVMFHTKQHIV